MAILKLYKNRGETPLECIKRFKAENPHLKNEKMTYAGRLDPLAEGLLLVLSGDDRLKKDEFLGMDKEYVVDVLFGFSTDTYDILGKVEYATKEDFLLPVNMNVTFDSLVGKFSQRYPPYSSKTINGKPLFSLARREELDEEEIPTKDVEIKSIEYIGNKIISKNDLTKYVRDSINLVKGDFRQKEILKKWTEILKITTIKKFPVITLKVSCTSGTYMRSLANSIGEKVGVPALAFNIRRTKIGEYQI